VECNYKVAADNEQEAMRQVYHAQVEPVLVGIAHAGMPGTGDSICECWELPIERQKLHRGTEP
jgi:hypothetical protein